MTAETFYKEANAIVEEVRDEEIVQNMVNWGEIPALPEHYEPIGHHEAEHYDEPAVAEDGVPNWLEVLADFPVTNVPANTPCVEATLSQMG